MEGDPCFHSFGENGTRSLNYPVRNPIGVCAIVSPWNLPLLLTTWKLGSALASGNTVVVKPSEETPASATLLVEVVHEAGVPTGVFNLVHGFGPESAGEFLVSHPDVDAITFTGESGTGSTIMKSAAACMKDISFELGGKNAGVIFADADLGKAVEGKVRSIFTNCGQVCLCTERVYVERPVFEQFIEKFKQKTADITLGDPLDANTDMGPLISREHRQKVLSYFDLVRKDGGSFVAGGGIPDFGDNRDEGAFIQPSIVTGLTHESRFLREEIFGPVCAVVPFDTEEEAIFLINDSEYGLAAALWTGDLSRAHRVSRKISAGIVWVNTWFERDLRTPFGGIGRSGIGREGGRYSMDFYSQVTNVCIAEN